MYNPLLPPPSPFPLLSPGLLYAAFLYYRVASVHVKNESEAAEKFMNDDSSVSPRDVHALVDRVDAEAVVVRLLSTLLDFKKSLISLPLEPMPFCMRSTESLSSSSSCLVSLYSYSLVPTSFANKLVYLLMTPSWTNTTSAPLISSTTLPCGKLNSCGLMVVSLSSPSSSVPLLVFCAVTLE